MVRKQTVLLSYISLCPTNPTERSKEQRLTFRYRSCCADYTGENEGDLSFNEGDTIDVLDQSDSSGWWQGSLNGAVGFFPSNFVEQI